MTYDEVLQVIDVDPGRIADICRTQPEIIVSLLKELLTRSRSHRLERQAADKYNFELQEWMATYRAALTGYCARGKAPDYMPHALALDEATRMHGPRPTRPK